jgi:O-antigen/teichoic acid export membrane protein
MNLRRILQVALTAFLGQGISIITQLLVPPFFLRFYPHGLEVYGEWIALSASVNYLGTLNYGIQTYANNEMSILYNRGETNAAKSVQASALRFLLLLIGLFLLGGSSIFLIPISRLLKLTHVNSRDASFTLYLLIVQMAVVMLFSLLTNSYMVVGKLHRGNYWANGQRLCSVLCMSLAIPLKASFPALASIQLGSLLLFFFFVFVDIRRTAPILLPSLGYGSWKQVASILKPSGHFGLIAMAGFLTWQAPVIVIQRFLGPATVGMFALVRVVFQMSRQILSVASSMISQDITLLVGQRDWVTLRRLYDLSERVVLLLIPIVSIGSLLMCPFLFTVWLHKRNLYNPGLCILMAILSAVLGIKEHKTQFQSSSNQHEALSVFILCGYSCMLIASIPMMRAFGLVGFMLTWILWEVIQTAFVLRLNKSLFPMEFQISMNPVLRLVALMSVSFAIAVWPAYHETTWPLAIVVVTATGVSLLLGAAAYFIFGLGEIRRLLQARLANRLVANS